MDPTVCQIPEAPHQHARGKPSRVGGAKWWPCADQACPAWNGGDAWGFSPRPTRRAPQPKPKAPEPTEPDTAPEDFAVVYRGAGESARRSLREAFSASEPTRALALRYFDAIDAAKE